MVEKQQSGETFHYCKIIRDFLNKILSFGDAKYNFLSYLKFISHHRPPRMNIPHIFYTWRATHFICSCWINFSLLYLLLNGFKSQIMYTRIHTNKASSMGPADMKCWVMVMMVFLYFNVEQRRTNFIPLLRKERKKGMNCVRCWWYKSSSVNILFPTCFMPAYSLVFSHFSLSSSLSVLFYTTFPPLHHHCNKNYIGITYK